MTFLNKFTPKHHQYSKQLHTSLSLYNVHHLVRDIAIIVSSALLLLLLLLIAYLAFRSLRRRRFPPTTTLPDQDIVKQLEAIPTTSYVGPTTTPSTRETCPVCLGEYVHGDEIRVLPPCKHAFHKACVDRWLTYKSTSCPMCRVRVVRRQEEIGMVGRGSSDGGNYVVMMAGFHVGTTSDHLSRM